MPLTPLPLTLFFHYFHYITLSPALVTHAFYAAFDYATIIMPLFLYFFFFFFFFFFFRPPFDRVITPRSFFRLRERLAPRLPRYAVVTLAFDDALLLLIFFILRYAIIDAYHAFDAAMLIKICHYAPLRYASY